MKSDVPSPIDHSAWHVVQNPNLCRSELQQTFEYEFTVRRGWCEQNLAKGSWTVKPTAPSHHDSGPNFLFKSAEDAVLFKLVWG